MISAPKQSPPTFRMFNRSPLIAFLLLPIMATADLAADMETYEGTIKPFVQKYCVSCHGAEKQKGKFRIDTLSQDLTSGPHADDWHEVLDALNLGEMPPEDEEQPGEAERTAVVDFLTGAFKEAAEKRRSTGGQVVMRRLTSVVFFVSALSWALQSAPAEAQMPEPSSDTPTRQVKA